MKKLLVLLTLCTISLAQVNATETTTQKPLTEKQKQELRIQRVQAFEKRLSLTEEQKVKAKELRIKGHEKIKPVMDEIISKKQEAKMIKMSRIAVQVQEERLDKIDKELKVLEKKAHDIRKANMKEFESILTRQQKRTLKQMKKEGRNRYHAQHPWGK